MKNLDFIKIAIPSDIMEKAIPSIMNDYGEIRETRPGSIIFDNGWVASIIVLLNNPEIKRFYPELNLNSETPIYSVAVCDYNGYFDWTVLKPFGANSYGTFICFTQEEIIKAVRVIMNLKQCQ